MINQWVGIVILILLSVLGALLYDERRNGHEFRTKTTSDIQQLKQDNVGIKKDINHIKVHIGLPPDGHGR